MDEKPWWFTQNEEHLHGFRPTRDEAISAGTHEFGSEPFMICQGGHFRNSCDIFDIDWIADRFNDANEEIGCSVQPRRRMVQRQRRD